MSYAGHVLDMIKKQKQNRILQQQHRDRLNAKKLLCKASSAKKFNTEKFSKKSINEINETRIRIQHETAKENKKTLIKAVITGCVLAVFFILIFKYL